MIIWAGLVLILATGGLVLWDHMRPVSTWSAPAYWVPIIWVLILLAFAASAYRIDAFSLAFWDCSRFLAVVGLLGLGISYLSGTPFLSNLWNGLFRAQSLMPEPAALAPLVSAGVLLSWNRRRISWLVVFVLVTRAEPSVLRAATMAAVGVALGIPAGWAMLELIGPLLPAELPAEGGIALRPQ